MLRAQPSTHLGPSRGASAVVLGPHIPPGSAQHHLRPFWGTWNSGLSPAPTFALPGVPDTLDSAQHPPWPFSGALGSGIRPPYPSRLSPAPTFSLLRGPGTRGSAQHPPWPFSGTLGSGGGPPYPSGLSQAPILALLGGPRQWHRVPVSLQAQPSTHLGPSRGPSAVGAGPRIPPGSAGPFFCLLTFSRFLCSLLRD